MCILVPIMLLIISVMVLTFLQSKTQTKAYLPNFLKTWDFLPLPLRSLYPYDKFLKTYLCCCKCFKKTARISPSGFDMQVQVMSLEQKPTMDVKF